jgi:hypothetical protein
VPRCAGARALCQDGAHPLADHLALELREAEQDVQRQAVELPWCDLFGDDATLLAHGFRAWAGAFFLNDA